MEKKYNYIILDKATSDMENIFHYIANTLMAESSALKLISNIEEKIELAAHNPRMYPVVDNSFHHHSYRRIIVDNHIIIYRIIEEENTILILRVLNNLQDWEHFI